MPSSIHILVAVLSLVSIFAAVGTLDYSMQVEKERIDVSVDDLDPDLVKQVNNYMRLSE
jgi:hypothetical protein